MPKKFLQRMFASRSHYRAYLQTQRPYDFEALSHCLNNHLPRMKFEIVQSSNKNHSCILYFKAHKPELRLLDRVLPEDVLMSLEKI